MTGERKRIDRVRPRPVRRWFPDDVPAPAASAETLLVWEDMGPGVAVPRFRVAPR